jgi:hypothetical protein
VRELGARRIAIGATYPEDVAQLFAEFLRAAGVEVVSVNSSGIITAAEVGTWGEAELLALARNSDHPDAEALLLPDTALHTAAHIPALEKELGKPVLTANQVTVWEGLRLADRRVNAPELGARSRGSRSSRREAEGILLTARGNGRGRCRDAVRALCSPRGRMRGPAPSPLTDGRSDGADGGAPTARRRRRGRP